MVCHKMYNKTLHQQHKFLLFQITIRSRKQMPPIHSQTFLHSTQPHHPGIHISSHCVLFISLLVIPTQTF